MVRVLEFFAQSESCLRYCRIRTRCQIDGTPGMQLVFPHSLALRLVMSHSFGIWTVVFTSPPAAWSLFFTSRLIFLES